MRFAKLHGLGNDFVLLDWRDRGPGAEPCTPALARGLSDRHRGVGGDGVLTLLAAEGGVRLVIHNPDGSRPEMCGNGARCAALWVASQGCRAPVPVGARVRLLTDAGVRDCVLEAGGRALAQVEIAMGVPALGAPRAFAVDGSQREALPVSMGNPHRVFLLGDAPPRPVLELAREAGPALCASEDANIEFVRRLGPRRYEAAVWERGAGLTLACGTGACAVAAAAVARGEAAPGEPVEVLLPGGPLTLLLDPGSGQVRMRGPAQLVFQGEAEGTRA